MSNPERTKLSWRHRVVVAIGYLGLRLLGHQVLLVGLHVVVAGRERLERRIWQCCASRSIFTQTNHTAHKAQVTINLLINRLLCWVCTENFFIAYRKIYKIARVG